MKTRLVRTLVFSIFGLYSFNVWAGCDHYSTECQSGIKSSCSKYVDCIGGVIDKTLDPIDSPEMKSLRYACQRGDAAACDREIELRNRSIRMMDQEIERMKRQ